MIKIMLIKNELSKDEKDFFEKMNPGFSVTGDVLCVESDDGSGEKYVVLKVRILRRILAASAKNIMNWHMWMDMLDSTRKLLTLYNK